MTASSGGSVRMRGPVDRGEQANQFWRSLAARLNQRAFLAGFLMTLVVVSVVLTVCDRWLDGALRAANLALRGADVSAEAGSGAYTLRDYLQSRRQPGLLEMAVVGASYTATTAEPDLNRRFDKELERALANRTGLGWRTVALASNGYNVWSCFAVARLVRVRHKPDVLLVGLDSFDVSNANGALVLAGGPDLRLFSIDELAPALEINRQPLYRAEAVAAAEIDTVVPFFETTRRARPRGLLAGLLGAARRSFQARAPVTPPRPISWQDNPEARALMAVIQRTPPVPVRIDPSARRELELLGAELALCREENIRVIVVTLPRNPVAPRSTAAASRELEEWAARYGIEFVNLWESDIVPTEYFEDTAHFTGGGARIVASVLAARLAGAARP